MLSGAVLPSRDDLTATAPAEDPTRWNRSLSKAFDVSQEQFPAASAEEALVSKYLDVEIKHLERRKTQIMSVRMGAFLTAVNEELRDWLIDDVRNIDWQGKETTPLYETIQLNSSTSNDFLINGMRFLRQEGDRTVKATFRVQPRWWGIDVTVYGLRSTGDAHHLVGRIQAAAKTINFLKGEAFSLSGEFLPKTGETFSDLFLDPANAEAVARVVKLINDRGKDLENRGVLLMGPPGTGKTLSARIVRNEAKATFIWVSSRDFHYSGSFGGFTEAFDLARECAPSVIVFEDVDNWLYDTTVDLLKSEMDGVAVRSGVVTMMTTNFPELLPAALIDRPGRFHDVLRFGLPDAGARKQMLERWLPGLAATDLQKAVDATGGYSGAHVRELARFAKIIAEQDGLTLAKALASALQKLAEQRELINATQRRGSHYRMPSELAGKCAVRVGRSKDYAEKGDTLDKVYRAHSRLEIKAVNEAKRTFTGMATTPTPDRVGDVIDPLGVEFATEMPLLLFHQHNMPVGTVRFGKPTADGIPFEAEIPDVAEPGLFKQDTDRAWHMVKYRVVKAVSIGFRSFLDFMERIKETGGWRFLKSEVMELSLVSVPANPEALISGVKSLSSASEAAPPGPAGHVTQHPHRPGTPAVRLLPSRQEQTMKSIAEQINSYKSTRDAKFQEQQGLMAKAADAGLTLDGAESETYDGLNAEVKALDQHIKRLEDLQAANASAAVPVPARAPIVSLTQGGLPVAQVKHDLPQGIGFARFAIASIMARKSGCTVMEYAKQRWPDFNLLHQFIQKATVPAGLTTNSDWMGNLVDPTNLASEFISYLRPMTIVGKFGTGNIPSLRRVPFNSRITGQSSGAVANWVGQGKPKPVTSFSTMATTLAYTKIAAIAVIAEELMRFSTPSAEALVRDELARAVIECKDISFVDPSQAAVANVSPASITNGVTPLSPSGTNEAAVRADITTLLAQFIEQNVDVSGLVLIMPNTLALATSIMVNSLGQPSFPGMTINGGSLLGIPVIASQYAGNQSGSGNLVIAANARDIALADDGEVSLDASREASIQMSDAPTNDASTGTGQSLVSMFQTNSVAILAELFTNWSKLRTNAVSFIDDVNWGSVGSPS